MNTLNTGRVRLVLALLLGYWATSSAQELQQPTVALPTELARILSDYEEAWIDENEKALAALFTEDGFVLSGGSPPIRGRNQIEQHYKDSGGPLALRAYDFAIEGAIGFIIGGYSQHKGDPDTGKFTLTLRKSSDGRWLIMSDMDNGN